MPEGDNMNDKPFTLALQTVPDLQYVIFLVCYEIRDAWLIRLCYSYSNTSEAPHIINPTEVIVKLLVYLELYSFEFVSFSPLIIMPPFEEEGHIALHLLVGR
jgi:hypothetical protein